MGGMPGARGSFRPGGQGMIGPADPSATLVLRGDGNGGRTVYRVQLILGCVLLLLPIGVALFLLSLTPGPDAGLITGNLFACFPTFTAFSQVVAHHVYVRRLAGTELWLSPHGVAYACASGCFGVPWPAVRWIGFRGRGAGYLCVEAVGWKGPISKLGVWWRGTRTLEISLAGADRMAVSHAIHAASGAHVAVPPG